MILKDATPFFSFSTNLLNESKIFYEDILGLETAIVEDRFLHVQLPYNQPLVIYYKVNHQPASYTVLNFQVTGIQNIVNEMGNKGVVFEQYDPPIQTDEAGISWDDEGSHIAWFKDPGGNILALIEN